MIYDFFPWFYEIITYICHYATSYNKLLTTAELCTKLNSAIISIGIEIQRIILRYFTKTAILFFQRDKVFLLQITILELKTLSATMWDCKAGSTREGCKWPCNDYEFWIAQEWIPQTLWTTCSLAANVFLQLNKISCISVCAWQPLDLSQGTDKKLGSATFTPPCKVWIDLPYNSPDWRVSSISHPLNFTDAPLHHLHGFSLAHSGSFWSAQSCTLQPKCVLFCHSMWELVYMLHHLSRYSSGAEHSTNCKV